MSLKRPLDSFFKPSQAKKPKVEVEVSVQDASSHSTYPFPVPQLPPSVADALGFAPAVEGRAINDQPDLDLLYFQPYIAKDIEKDMFDFLRQELFFYRVEYRIKRGSVETLIKTPRYTTVFGVDGTSRFSSTDGSVLDSKTNKPVQKDRYKAQPRPLPGCLDALRIATEGSTGETYNFCLVNYYANGSDSISYHSDDERFLGSNPAIASFSLGAKRSFLMKHKPAPPSATNPPEEAKPLKLPLASGDMILMRGPTQSNWLHSIPKRKGGESEKGRINITFRKAITRGASDNYYNYNVGTGGVFRWDPKREEMMPWSPTAHTEKTELA